MRKLLAFPLVGLLGASGIGAVVAAHNGNDDPEREHVWLDMPPLTYTINGCRDGVLYEVWLYEPEDWDEPFGSVVPSSDPLLWIIPEAGRCDEDPSDEANESSTSEWLEGLEEES